MIVFISYSHDSDEHRDRVLALSERLRADGIETILDRYVEHGSPTEGWPRWMLNGLDNASHVLTVCTQSYYRRFRGHEVPDKGKGVDWEGALITQTLYDSKSTSIKFLPVVFDAADVAYIPEPLRGQSHHLLTSEQNYQALYDALLNQSGVEPGPIGALKPKSRARGSPLRFGDTPGAAATVPPDISRIVKYAPAQLIGREAEIALLNNAWEKALRDESPRPCVLTFVALGGEGKTSLAAKWVVDEMLAKGWRGCDAAFAWSFYSQGTREQVAASSDLFLKEALVFFGDADMANSDQGAFDKGRRLAQLVGARRALLILDGVEPLQYAPTSPTAGELKDQGLAALLKGLAASSRGLCVVTTRYSIADLRAYGQTTAPEHKLLRLSQPAGAALLQQLGVKGNQKELETLVRDVQGHALTLNLLGSYLHDAHAGDIRKRDLIKLEEADAEEQGGHAFRVMDAYAVAFECEGEKGQRALALMRLLGLFDRPADAGCLAALWKTPVIAGLTEPLLGLSEAQRNIAYTRLESAKLLTVNRDAAGTLLSLDGHPLLREYFAQQLRTLQAEAWRTAHRRLYEYLCASTKEGEQATLADLQPLYQAVAHGRQAGLLQEAYQKIYLSRITKGNENYSAKKLGAFGSDLGAVSCFFETPWSRVTPVLTEVDQASLLNETAFCLRAVGRLTEALEPMRVGLVMGVKQENWKEAAIIASNLSELELTLGAVADAVRDAEQAVTYADRGNNAPQKVINRKTHADSLHQAGHRVDAEARFREAEEMQAERQPSYPVLYSLAGFLYCDLLMTQVERTAWRQLLACGDKSSLSAGNWSPTSAAMRGQGPAQLPRSATRPTNWSSVKKGDELRHVKTLHAVSERALQTFRWAEQNKASLLTIALEHLTLGRAELYRAILEKSNFRVLTSDISHTESAVAGLRRAGTTHHLPRSLLTRAWQLSLTGRPIGPDSAQSDLDEAWEIAERGPMKLFMADIHLYRARLFFRDAKYPWVSPAADLAAAEKLINDCGYHRRDEELADAKRVILGG